MSAMCRGIVLSYEILDEFKEKLSPTIEQIMCLFLHSTDLLIFKFHWVNAIEYLTTLKFLKDQTLSAENLSLQDFLQ